MKLKTHIKLKFLENDNTSLLYAIVKFKLPNKILKTKLQVNFVSYGDCVDCFSTFDNDKFLEKCMNILNDKNKIIDKVKLEVINYLDYYYKKVDKSIKENDMNNMVDRINGKNGFDIEVAYNIKL